MRSLLLVFLLFCNCSSSQKGSSVDCQIIGTYTDKTISLDKNTCGQAAKVGDAADVTISAGNAVDEYLITIGGVPGGCPATTSVECKIQTTSCELRGVDGSLMATFQFSATFDEGGFDSYESTTLSATASTAACTVTGAGRGTRR